MKTELMQTQVEDIEKHSEIFDLPNYSEPGTGKTLTTIGAIEKLNLSNGIVICPPVATLMWVELLSYELNANVQWVKTRTQPIDRGVDFHVMSYGVLLDNVERFLHNNFGALVIDESHYCKSIQAARTRAVFGVTGNGDGGLTELSDYCFTMTGTPIERYADDLWSQLRAIQPEALAKYNALSLPEFQRQFCRMATKTYNNHETYVSVGTQNERMLNRMLYTDIGIIRRTMAEVDEFMPETAPPRTIYVQSKINKELKDIIKNKTMEQLQKMLIDGGDIASAARRILGMSKLKDVVDYIYSQAISHQVLVGYWHTDFGLAIVEALKNMKIKAALIGGGTSAENRDKIKKQLIAGDIQVIVGQIAAMGVAMDGLQYATDHVIFAEDEWSSSKFEQFYKRVARKGQRKHVTVDVCQSSNPIDQAIENIRFSKVDSAARILKR